MGAIVNDDTLNLMSIWNNLIKLVNTISNEETISTINDLLGLYGKMKEIRLTDVVKGVLEDEETIGKLMNAIVNDFTLNLLANWGQIVDDLSRFDLTNSKYYTLSMNETGEALMEEKIVKIDR